MVEHKINKRETLRSIINSPEYAPYFLSDRIFVAGTIFYDGNALLVRQQIIGTNKKNYPAYKIPGGVLKNSNALKSIEGYKIALREELIKKGYSLQEQESILRKHDPHFEGRTMVERFFVLKFLSETGIVPLDFSFVFKRTAYSALKGEENDPSKSILKLYFIVRRYCDAWVGGSKTDVRMNPQIQQRKFRVSEEILEPRVLMPIALAEQKVIKAQREPLLMLYASAP